MVHHIMNIKLVEQWIAILHIGSVIIPSHEKDHQLTLETDAVKTTTSYNSPTRFMN